MRKIRDVPYIYLTFKCIRNFFYDYGSHRPPLRSFLLRLYLGISPTRLPVNRTLVASLMLSLTCRISKDCAHTASCELTQRRALRSAFVRRDRRKRGDTRSRTAVLSAIYRSFVNDPRARLCTDSENSIASFSPPLVPSSVQNIMDDRCRLPS